MDTRQQLQRLEQFVASTSPAVFVRRADSLLMIRPDKTMKLNHSAAEILAELYRRERPPLGQALPRLAARLRVSPERLLADTGKLLEAVGAVLNEDFTPRPALAFGDFDRGLVKYPTLAEIALTYGCQNRCRFCYAESPGRPRRRPLMNTAQVKLVIDKIFGQAHVPSLSFTGGEPTLRADLPELISHAVARGLRVNLISNGIRAGNPDYATRLVEAGLHSAQISLEAATAGLHDRLVGRQGAWRLTVAGVGNFQRRGIHVHTNTTLCAENLAHAPEIIRFVARELGLKTMSMNMVIRTGSALAQRQLAVSYRQVAGHLPGLVELARREGVRLVWYSPIPYCLFNPVLHGLGAKSCACVDGILSVDPSGQVLPCSSFEQGIGSLLKRSFASIWRSRRARYWRDKKFLPPVCRHCDDADVCGGACPLYWDAAGSFAELPRPGSGDERARRRWEKGRRRSGTFGVRPRATGEA